jgi:hypothetical protein
LLEAFQPAASLDYDGGFIVHSVTSAKCRAFSSMAGSAGEILLFLIQFATVRSTEVSWMERVDVRGAGTE